MAPAPIAPAPGVDMRLRPDTLTAFQGMAREFQEVTGGPIRVSSGYRSTESQARLYAKYPARAAKPGRSLHEYGVAVDVDREDANKLAGLGLLGKYGFWRPLMRPHIRNKEPWHLERKGLVYSAIRTAGYIPVVALGSGALLLAIGIFFILSQGR